MADKTVPQKKGQPGRGANADPKIALLRAAMTKAMNSYGIGGLPKRRKRPPITLPGGKTNG